jgi:hypothetical protein
LMPALQACKSMHSTCDTEMRGRLGEASLPLDFECLDSSERAFRRGVTAFGKG